MQPKFDIRFPAIAAELNAMFRRDQEMRNAPQFDSDIDRAHTKRLKEIVAQIGWPTHSLVGVEGSRSAFFLAQHADLDPTFQATALAMMKDCRPGEVDPSLVAYLEDRVLIGKGQSQMYGTQGHLADGVWRPFPIESEHDVDTRRAAVGLEPLSEYIRFCTQAYLGGGASK